MDDLTWPQAFAVVGLAWTFMLPAVAAIWGFCKLGAAYYQARGKQEAKE